MFVISHTLLTLLTAQQEQTEECVDGFHSIQLSLRET